MEDSDKKSFQKALNKVAQLLARRNHSEKELRQKLGDSISSSLVDEVIAEAKERNWLLPPEELSQSAAESWSRANKSARYIAEQLKKRGLPPIHLNDEDELEKIRILLEKKFHKTEGSGLNLSYDDKTKAYRFLKYRGFSDRLIRKVIHEQP